MEYKLGDKFIDKTHQYIIVELIKIKHRFLTTYHFDVVGGAYTEADIKTEMIPIQGILKDYLEVLDD